jgi:hypothetical protein
MLALRQARQRALLTAPKPPESFLARQIAELGQDAPVQPHPAGYSLAGRAYVAVDCHCGHQGCPGWAMVHDDPDARAYFQRLFGAARP